MHIYNYIKENILIPRNIEGRQEKLRQHNIKLLSQEIINADEFVIDNTFDNIPLELIKVKKIIGNVFIFKLNKIPSWLKNVIIIGDFNCSSNRLTSLENCPDNIMGTFDCTNNFISNLNNFPKNIKSNIDLSTNKLINLNGLPENVEGSLFVDNNYLKNLKGSPKYIRGNFDCRGNKLESLEGSPEYIGRDFICVDNNLKSLEGCPKLVEGNFKCFNNIIELELPKNAIVKGHFINENLNLFSETILVPRNLEGRQEKLRQDVIKLLSQEVIKGSLEIDELFEGIPKELIKVKEIKGFVWLKIRKGYIPEWLKDVKIHGNFDCSRNNLTTLENCPQYVGGTFYCENNQLTSLDGCPKYIGISIICTNNKIKLELPDGLILKKFFFN